MRGDVPFVVKIAQYNLQSSIIVAKRVFVRNMHVFKSNVSSTSGGRIRRLDLFRFDTWATFYEENNHSSLVVATAYCKVVCESRISNPFLFPYVSGLATYFRLN